MVALAGLAEAGAELGGGFAVAEETEGAEVVEIALASALGDWEDVVGVPERSSAGDGLHAVEREAGDASGATAAFEGVVDGNGIGLAENADTVIAGEDLVAEIAGVGAETPLVDAVVAAEGAAAFGEDFEVAPAAEGQVVRSKRERFACGAAAGKGARGEHAVSIFSETNRWREWLVGFGQWKKQEKVEDW